MMSPRPPPAPNTVRSDRSKILPIASDNREAFVWKSSRQASKNSEFRHASGSMHVAALVLVEVLPGCGLV
jgi:hypothetical protein